MPCQKDQKHPSQFQKRERKMKAAGRIITERFIVTAVVLSLGLACTSAWAQEPGDDSIDEDLATLYLEEGTLLLGGFVFAIGNMSYASNGVQSPVGWRVAGNIGGVLNIITGGVIIGVLLAMDDVEISNRDLWMGLGIGHLAMGALDIGTSAWGYAQAPSHETQVKVSPVVIPSKNGPPAIGAGLSIVGW